MKNLCYCPVKEQALLKVTTRGGRATICCECAEPIYQAVAAERTCATCSHFGTMVVAARPQTVCLHPDNEAAAPDGWFPIALAVTATSYCNQWQPQEEVAPCKT